MSETKNTQGQTMKDDKSSSPQGEPIVRPDSGKVSPQGEPIVKPNGEPIVRP